MTNPLQVFRRILILSFLAVVPVHGFTATLGGFAYIGDSEVALGGIGRGLSCLNQKNIVAFGNAKASTYVGGEPCKLYGSYHATDRGNFCALAKTNFQKILSQPSIDTVVVGLGDNVNSVSSFKKMLQAIRAKHKRCVWVMPAQKVGKNANTQLAIKTLTSYAKQYCGNNNLINPSAKGKRFATRSDGVHYQPAAGRQIGQNVCKAMQKLGGYKVPSEAAPKIYPRTSEPRSDETPSAY